MIKRSDINVNEARKLIDRMSIKDKVKLFRELSKQTWTKRIDNIRIDIDRRRRKLNISMSAIKQDIDKARQEFYARRR